MLLNVAAAAGYGVGGEMGRGLKAAHATGRAEGVSDLEEGGVGQGLGIITLQSDGRGRAPALKEPSIFEPPV